MRRSPDWILRRPESCSTTPGRDHETDTAAIPSRSCCKHAASARRAATAVKLGKGRPARSAVAAAATSGGSGSRAEGCGVSGSHSQPAAQPHQRFRQTPTIGGRPLSAHTQVSAGSKSPTSSSFGIRRRRLVERPHGADCIEGRRRQVRELVRGEERPAPTRDHVAQRSVDRIGCPPRAEDGRCVAEELFFQIERCALPHRRTLAERQRWVCPRLRCPA